MKQFQEVPTHSTRNGRGGMLDPLVLILCVVFTLIWARIAAVFANKAEPKTLNRATGVVLTVLGVLIFAFNIFA